MQEFISQRLGIRDRFLIGRKYTGAFLTGYDASGGMLVANWHLSREDQDHACRSETGKPGASSPCVAQQAGLQRALPLSGMWTLLYIITVFAFLQ
ncbi:hypothetical protein AVEN_28006-1 [Araneus ventricosus]|uniref:Uncharacterized protein n=1 Tax=Araneus ventricosus TaxID=182803 RepID=A0A4Y2BIC0_ARAVE|nr:hypothetical protein AVEN_28006-1 [Araneus ventricosus]